MTRKSPSHSFPNSLNPRTKNYHACNPSDCPQQSARHITASIAGGATKVARAILNRPKHAKAPNTTWSPRKRDRYAMQIEINSAITENRVSMLNTSLWCRTLAIQSHDRTLVAMPKIESSVHTTRFLEYPRSLAHCLRPRLLRPPLHQKLLSPGLCMKPDSKPSVFACVAPAFRSGPLLLGVDACSLCLSLSVHPCLPRSLRGASKGSHVMRGNNWASAPEKALFFHESGATTDGEHLSLTDGSCASGTRKSRVM